MRALIPIVKVANNIHKLRVRCPNTKVSPNNTLMLNHVRPQFFIKLIMLTRFKQADIEISKTAVWLYAQQFNCRYFGRFLRRGGFFYCFGGYGLGFYSSGF